MPAEHSSLRGRGNHEHESHLRSPDNPHSDKHQPHVRATDRHEHKGENSGEHGTVGFTGAYHYDHGEGCCKAEHHPPAKEHGHKMGDHHVSGSHGFGHKEHQRHGHHRHSGHSKAHRIGHR